MGRDGRKIIGQYINSEGRIVCQRSYQAIFGDVRYLQTVQAGAWAKAVAFWGNRRDSAFNDKTREVRADLFLDDLSIEVRRIPGYQTLKEVSWCCLKSAKYSTSMHPSFFVKRHWLTLKTEEDCVTLCLARKNYKDILVHVEEKSGLSIQRIIED